MKLVFDDGTEQEILQDDFYKIIIRAEAMADENERRFIDKAVENEHKAEYSQELFYLRSSAIENSISNLCKTLESLYF